VQFRARFALFGANWFRTGFVQSRARFAQVGAHYVSVEVRRASLKGALVFQDACWGAFWCTICQGRRWKARMKRHFGGNAKP